MLPKRLLDVKTFEIVETSVLDRLGQLKQRGEYAIVSHRLSGSKSFLEWDVGETTFKQYKDNKDAIRQSLPNPHGLAYDQKPGLAKIARACKLAVGDKIPYVWTDTCCIDKSNAIEEEQAINSMFPYYRDASICYIFLSDVSSDPNAHRQADYQRMEEDTDEIQSRCKIDIFDKSEWFTRGWTSQELLATRGIRFYDHHWQQIGTRKEMIGDFSRVTGIAERHLKCDIENELSETCIAIKMSWAAGRTTTLKEDMAYCKLGILGVSLKPQYGEAEKEFLRLQQKLVKFADESIFAWVLDREQPSNVDQQYDMLAPWISCFRYSTKLTVEPNNL